MPFNRLNHSILGEIRPRFSLEIFCEPEQAMEQLKESLKKDPTVASLRSNHTSNYIFLTVPASVTHYWSPEMTVRVEKGEFSGKVLTHCLIGPKQSVWAFFTFIYAAIFILSLFGGMYGIVEWKTHGSSPFIWVFPIGLVLWSTVFISSKIGQQKGRDQMLHLVSFVYHSLSEISEVHRVEKN
jgi:hypothetical protein